eukprot:1195693-Prorocentrum_minimum.AAC.6
MEGVKFSRLMGIRKLFLNCVQDVVHGKAKIEYASGACYEVGLKVTTLVAFVCPTPSVEPLTLPGSI